MLMYVCESVTEGSGNGNHWYTLLFGSLGYTDGSFIVDCLKIELAFAGNYQICVFQILLEAN